jgi:hypothetical protein
MPRLFRIGFVVVAICMGMPIPGHAEGRPTQLADHKPGSKATAIELELGFFTRSAGGSSLTALVPHFDLRHAFSEHAELTADWPLEIAFVSGGGTRIDSGNPSAAFYYMNRQQDGYFRIGGGLGLPLAPDSLLAQTIARVWAVFIGGGSRM